MRGGGLILNLAFIALAICTALGGIALWFVLITFAERLFEPILGKYALPVAFLGFPFALGGCILLLLRTVGPRGFTWALLLGAAIAFFFGAWLIWYMERKK